jgi:hypothetical protein
MIYSRFGTRITLTSKPDTDGWCKAIFHLTGHDSEREIHSGDMKGDGGGGEIDSAWKTLPAHDGKKPTGR